MEDIKDISTMIDIKVNTFYSHELSQPDKSRYVFIYKVEIINNSDHQIQLLSRRWRVIENDGIIHNVEGEGVIGLQPIILEKEGFEYSSQAVLFQNSAIMYGKYFFMDLNTGTEFDAIIPAFNLSYKDEFEGVN